MSDAQHDLQALRAHPGHPGEEAPRTELLNAVASTAPRRTGRARFCLNGHLDVVGPGEQAWRRPPFDGAIDHGGKLCLRVLELKLFHAFT